VAYRPSEKDQISLRCSQQSLRLIEKDCAQVRWLLGNESRFGATQDPLCPHEPVILACEARGYHVIRRRLVPNLPCQLLRQLQTCFAPTRNGDTFGGDFSGQAWVWRKRRRRRDGDWDRGGGEGCCYGEYLFSEFWGCVDCETTLPLGVRLQLSDLALTIHSFVPKILSSPHFQTTQSSPSLRALPCAS
jgi:hypothetical protein